MNYTEKNKLLDKVSLIILMAIFVLIFLYGVDYCYTDRMDTIPKMPVAMIVFGVIFLLVSVGIFVYCKKKDKKALKIYSYEFLALAIICPIIDYLYYPKFFGLSTGWIHKHLDRRIMLVVAFVYFAGRVAYACYEAYKKSNASKPKKKKLKAKRSA